MGCPERSFKRVKDMSGGADRAQVANVFVTVARLFSATTCIRCTMDTDGESDQCVVVVWI